MSIAPSQLDTHAAQLAEHGVVPFLELVPHEQFVEAAYYRWKSTITLATTGAMTLAALAATIVVATREGLAGDRWRVLLGASAFSALLFFGCYVGFSAYGRIQQRLREQFPQARLLELSRFGLRVSEQGRPTALEGPFVDAHGRALVPWTAWSEVLDARVEGESLTLTLRSLPGGIELRLTPVGNIEAQALATALLAGAPQSAVAHVESAHSPQPRSTRSSPSATPFAGRPGGRRRYPPRPS